mmetsp:Transcript_16624/g.24566  ORF Transcript_16624/g.24566 Transcript_16624/m.24566 type:complete len:182 (+) Transcript_16624:122-667(+)
MITTPLLNSILEQGWLAPLLVEYMDPKEATRFACVSRVCRVVSLQKKIVGLNQEECEWHGPTQVYSARPWQNLPILQKPKNVHTVFLKCRWRDQGWGNRKGMISVVTKSGTPPNDDKPWNNQVVCGSGPAPHDLTPLLLQFRPKEEQQPYKIWLRVGGGGGHRLVVEDLSIHVLSYKCRES